MQTDGREHPTLTFLHKATYGLLLFAVPHKGLDVEDMKEIMGAEGNSRHDLIHQIRIESKQLRQQLGDFKDVLHDRKVVTFYETEQSRRLKKGMFDSPHPVPSNFTNLG